jgi:hypothetical protein
MGNQQAQAGAMQASIRENFNSLFMTAAYSTVLGGALGAAALGFSGNPRSKLRYIPIGASAGFISGSLLGTYFIFVPSFSRSGKTRNDDDLEGFSQQQDQSIPPQVQALPGVAFYPVLNLAHKRVESWRLNWTIATF